MATKHDALKVLDKRYSTKRFNRTTDKLEEVNKDIRIIENAICDKLKTGIYVDISGYKVVITKERYDCTYKIVDKKFISLEKKKEKEEALLDKERTALDKRYEEIKEHILLHGVDKDIIKIIQEL